ncbi:hypothetical protein EDWATA_02927 [Edwardsiella tarda ATCC 23685]|uniref:Uncharacterized protein n=1 Tax=Edwardsiella tarda ATCC 23685 TaxID=500638 RepID=D4F840_EDWTA|nr:hypothetical protein EDWATA_02927 [Edwardsiella tarda ATCC 23685]
MPTKKMFKTSNQTIDHFVLLFKLNSSVLSQAFKPAPNRRHRRETERGYPD